MEPTRLVTGVVLRPRTFSVKGVVELEGNIIHTSGGTPSSCPAGSTTALAPGRVGDGAAAGQADGGGVGHADAHPHLHPGRLTQAR